MSLQLHLLTKICHEGTWDLLAYTYIFKYLQSMGLFSDLRPSSTDLPHWHLLALSPMSVHNPVLFLSSKWCYDLCVGFFKFKMKYWSLLQWGIFHSTIMEVCVTLQGVSWEDIWGHLRSKSFWNKQGNMGKSSTSAAVLKMLPVGDGPGLMPYPQIMPRLCLREN